MSEYKISFFTPVGPNENILLLFSMSNENGVLTRIDNKEFGFDHKFSLVLSNH